MDKYENKAAEILVKHGNFHAGIKFDLAQSLRECASETFIEAASCIETESDGMIGKGAWVLRQRAADILKGPGKGGV